MHQLTFFGLEAAALIFSASLAAGIYTAAAKKLFEKSPSTGKLQTPVTDKNTD